MFWHLFGVATLGKPVLALGIIVGAYGAGNAVVASEYRTPNPPAHETARPQTSPKPTPAAEPAATTLSFDALLSECVARYKRGAANTKEACDKAIAASGLSMDAFVAMYRSLWLPRRRRLLRSRRQRRLRGPRKRRRRRPSRSRRCSASASPATSVVPRTQRKHAIARSPPAGSPRTPSLPSTGRSSSRQQKAIRRNPRRPQSRRARQSSIRPIRELGNALRNTRPSRR